MLFLVEPGPAQAAIIAATLRQLIPEPSVHILLLCIGTPKWPGDSVGPRVGSRLLHLLGRRYLGGRIGRVPSHYYQKAPILISDRLSILGTEKAPITRRELLEGSWTKSLPPDATIVATDAGFTSPLQKIFSVSIGAGPLIPASGTVGGVVPVGDFHICGLVAEDSSLAGVRAFRLWECEPLSLGEMVENIALGIMLFR